jgi:hypothetical protein
MATQAPPSYAEAIRPPNTNSSSTNRYANNEAKENHVPRAQSSNNNSNYSNTNSANNINYTLNYIPTVIKSVLNQAFAQLSSQFNSNSVAADAHSCEFLGCNSRAASRCSICSVFLCSQHSKLRSSLLIDYKLCPIHYQQAAKVYPNERERCSILDCSARGNTACKSFFCSQALCQEHYNYNVLKGYCPKHMKSKRYW